MLKKIRHSLNSGLYKNFLLSSYLHISDIALYKFLYENKIGTSLENELFLRLGKVLQEKLESELN